MGYGRILITLDGTPLAERALDQVISVASPNAQVHLLSVLGEDRVADLAAISAAMAQTGAISDNNWREVYNYSSQEKQDRETYLDEIASRLEQVGLKVTCEVQQGDPIERITRVARTGFDVILIATHSRTRLGRVFFGSVTEGVLHHVSCPILIVPNSAASAE